MKAFVIERYGKQEPLHLAEVPEPKLGEQDVLVRIHAASINPLDLKIRSGALKRILPLRLPLVLGNDLAGVVTQVGTKVQRFKPGDEVYARTDTRRIGTFAEFIAVAESNVALKPPSLSMAEAASIPLVGLTAWQALVEKGNLRKGQKVFIHAGSGGVGTLAIQLAKHLGASVATTTSSANVALVKSLGADIVIDYKKDDFAKTLRDYDLVLHSLGSEELEKSVGILKPGGQLITISGPADPEFAKNNGMPKLVQMIVGLLSRKIRKKAGKQGVGYSFLFMRGSGEQLSTLGELIHSGAIRPTVDRVFPFEETNEALAYVEGGRTRGKAVIQVVALANQA
ncbi:NADP-dependent oxidoreductase [Pseudomonas sp. PDM14]|uniref:NADP-dependent oxidoreductase n=1 Tax=Pseudomonas sp. PDM14 TaxID=2769288 RepID=UPI00177C7ED0|nr:NADP-dependent oxidoreductase [Pseudomonas sp. PDM14]MBD9482494.1 NADP-dependent oxidoreductase [Pseudomonas sp. PDM14]